LFQIGFIEILFIGLVILLLFGPERLPEISKIIIKNTTRLKRKFSSFREDIERDIGADEIKQDIFNEFKLEELEKNESEKS
jgi:sec-independent protein translocase protein TatB